ncbi:MAG: Gfo/Idh/MocA family oxidoreductase [Myxococcota bacterium]
MAPTLDVAVIGCGVMGARHAACVARDPDVRLFTVDIHPERARALAAAHGGSPVTSPPASVAAAIVATPTSTHAEVAAPLLARGLWCLVEKPLAATAASARGLFGPRCVVGQVERFNPAVRAAGDLHPREVEAIRTAPPAGRGLDVHVALDLLIHDLDLVLGWAPDDARWVVDRAEGDVDQLCATIHCATLTATFRCSRVADRRERVVSCRGEDGITTLDLAAGRAWRGGIELARDGGPDALTCQWRAVRAQIAADEPANDRGAAAVELAERIVARIG